MGKKNILLLTGSPRKNGNSDKLADAFTKGALSQGHRVSKFEAGRKKISGCIACKSCWRTDRPCAFHDDFDDLHPLLEKADVLVFCSPIYWFGFPSQLKAAIDKINAYLSDECPRPLKIRETFLLTCGADDGDEIFSGIIETYQKIAGYMNWESKGILAVPGVHEIGDIDSTDMLSKAEELAKLL